MTPRQRWKVWYRQWRIIRRESLKAHKDVMLFGTGCVIITNGPDYIKYVPILEVVFEWPISS